jgi:hypothetical protein
MSLPTISGLAIIISILYFVSSQKDGGSGVLWTGRTRPQHPTPRIIEKILYFVIDGLAGKEITE